MLKRRDKIMSNVLSISKTTKVYVYCPAGIVTGGAELLHQLVDVINKNSLCAGGYIVYFGDAPHEIPNDYKKYDIKLASTIEDSPEHVVVIYEGIFNFYFDICNAQVVFWWLSVDNFYICQAEHIVFNDLVRFNILLAFRALKQRVKLFLLRKKIRRYSLKKLCDDKKICCHAYQSEYARDFLLKKGFENLMPLKDYINEDYVHITDYPKKEDIVIYNPKKGYAFTKKLIEHGKTIHWIPIKNMTRAQVKEVMLKSKVYIDFGYHPGKDRLPREAAMCRCCIITGKKGSAKYYGDIPIDEVQYKFTQSRKNIPMILNKIQFLLDNYETEIETFSEYRNKISIEKEEFAREVAALLCDS